MADNPDPDEVLGFLSGKPYPSNRAALLDHARERGAGDAALKALGRIPEAEYDSPTAVRDELMHAGD